jgi:hypothetical protein
LGAMIFWKKIPFKRLLSHPLTTHSPNLSTIPPLSPHPYHNLIKP